MSDVQPKNLNVGLIMPIAPIDGCSAEHWAEVKSIFAQAFENVSDYKCSVNLVSDADEIGVIQKRIVQNIYSSDIVICDVSCKNPNVMFELGMRLAFDKPTVIVKDDLTNYTFDTGIIEHLEYPRDLRFTKIVEFKQQLAKRTIATYEKSLADSEHSTFLKNFGEFKVVTLNEKQVSPDNLVFELLNDIQADIASLKRQRNNEFTRLPGQFINYDVERLLGIYLSNAGLTQEDLKDTEIIDAARFIQSNLKKAHNIDIPMSRVFKLLNIVMGGNSESQKSSQL